MNKPHTILALSLLLLQATSANLSAQCDTKTATAVGDTGNDKPAYLPYWNEGDSVDMVMDVFDYFSNAWRGPVDIKMKICPDNVVKLTHIANVVASWDGLDTAYISGKMSGDTLRIATGQTYFMHKTAIPMTMYAASSYDEWNDVYTEIPELRFAYSVNSPTGGCFRLVNSDWLISTYNYSTNEVLKSHYIRPAVDETGGNAQPMPGEPEKYTLQMHSTPEGMTETRTVNVLRDDNKIFVQGLWRWTPKGWLKLINKDGKWLCPGEQFLGEDAETSFVTKNESKRDDAFIEFKLSEDTLVSNTTDHLSVVDDTSGEQYGDYTSLRLVPLVTEPAKPSAPTDVTVEYASQYDKHYTQIYFEPVSEEGAFINTDSLYIRTYIDGQPHTFTTSVYTGLTEDMELIPVLFTDDYDMGYAAGRYQIFVCEKDFATIGFQMVYRVNGQEQCSGITTYDMESGEVVGIGQQFSEAQARVMSTDYYDIAGIRVNEDYKGICIKVTRYDDGSIKTDKLIGR